MEQTLEVVCIPSHRVAPSSLTGLKRLSQKPDGRFFTPEILQKKKVPLIAAPTLKALTCHWIPAYAGLTRREHGRMTCLPVEVMIPTENLFAASSEGRSFKSQSDFL